MPEARPNILLITAHDLGRHLGAYGYSTVVSPNLDGFARQGVRFDAAFAAAPQCSPSRAALATGRYPHSNGVMGLTHPPFSWDLHGDERHAAQIFGEHGYTTHLFGHQHVTPHVDRLGFDHVHPYPGQKAFAHDVSPQVTQFLSGTSLEHPFYMEVNLEETHRPYGQGGAEPDRSRGVFVPPYLPPVDEAEAEVAELQGDIRAADGEVGDIIRALDDAGLGDTTLTVFTVDHGVAMPGAKCTLYDRGTEIALLMRWPEGMPGERAYSDLISNVDILPTLLEAASISVSSAVQGRSFLPLVQGAPYVPRSAVFTEKTFHSYYDPMRAVRTERYKLIRNFESAFQVEVPGDIKGGALFRATVERYQTTQAHPDIELYDLAQDPLEDTNLAADAVYGDILAHLDDVLWTWMEETDDPLLRGPVPSPQYRRALRRESQQSG